MLAANPHRTEPVQPLVTTPVVVLTIIHERVQTLLMPDKGSWTLPGRVVSTDEDLDVAALQTLHGHTRMSDVYLEQLYTLRVRGAGNGHACIAVCYYALLSPGRLQEIRWGPAAWYPLDDLPRLGSGQRRIVDLAHARLASKLDYSTIAFHLLPPVFTLSAVQRVYEIVRNEVLDKRNFRKRILALDCVRDTGRLFRSGSHRPARLYEYVAPGDIRYLR